MGVKVEIIELAARIAKLRLEHRMQPLAARRWSAHLRRWTAPWRWPVVARRGPVRSRRAVRAGRAVRSGRARRSRGPMTVWTGMASRGPAPDMRRMPVRRGVVMRICRGLVLVRRRTGARRPRVVGRGAVAVWRMVHARRPSSRTLVIGWWSVRVVRRAVIRGALGLGMVVRRTLVIGWWRGLLPVGHIAISVEHSAICRPPVVSASRIACVGSLPSVLPALMASASIAVRVRRACAPSAVLYGSAVGRAMGSTLCSSMCTSMPVCTTMPVHVCALAICRCATCIH